MKKKLANIFICFTILAVGCLQYGYAQDKPQEDVAVLTPALASAKEITVEDVQKYFPRELRFAENTETVVFNSNVVTLQEMLSGSPADIERVTLKLPADTSERLEITQVPQISLFLDPEEPAEPVTTEDAAEPANGPLVPAEEAPQPEPMITNTVAPDRVVEHRSTYCKNAAITLHINGEETEGKTVFKSGIELDYDLDQYINDIEDIELLYKLVQSEAGGESSLGRRLVADCVLNMSRTKGISVKQAILNPGVFDVVTFGTIFNTVPSESTIECVNTELISQIDYAVMYFRTGHYHDFGVPYEHVGSHYFSKPSEDVASQWHD